MDNSDITGDIDDLVDEPSEDDLLVLLERLKSEHRRIDKEIRALEENGVSDMLKIKRMKKIKLSIKDQVTYLENMLTPDIIA
ncbi:YdcH family protein [Fretibacter rubidus]|uniref:YdcH family protein n=1 Tax=Fretibacter rubidus TaxID=570162 RepID=UPI00352A9C40